MGATLREEVISAVLQQHPQRIPASPQPSGTIGPQARLHRRHNRATTQSHISPPTNTLDSNDIRAALATAIRAYEPSRRIRIARLIPFKDEICDFRKRGASFETIAILLKNHSIEMSYETVRRFYRQAVEQKNPESQAKTPWPAQNAPPSGRSEIPTAAPGSDQRK